MIYINIRLKISRRSAGDLSGLNQAIDLARISADKCEPWGYKTTGVYSHIRAFPVATQQ